MTQTLARSRQPRADRTRAHIIEIAALAFAEHGYEGVSLNELVKASRVSKGAFYFHFSSKEELALAAFRVKQEELMARLLGEEAPTSVSERAAFLLRRRAALIREDPSLGCVTRLGSDLNVRSEPGSTYASF
ncbi:MAG TPA: TetR family transcriptional regulator, partial [Actinomycetes bacterium]|nr:TetR family transcriptional regulator [Actinomycetes bacterium]